jgi:hypothetical protein
MTSTTATPVTAPSTSVRVGLGLSAVIGAANLPALIPDIIDWGSAPPPFGLLLVNAAIGLVSVVCAALAWNTGNRRAIRINAAALILNAIMVVPGFFVDTTPAVTLISAAFVFGTVIAVVLMMRREPAAMPVTD